MNRYVISFLRNIIQSYITLHNCIDDRWNTLNHACTHVPHIVESCHENIEGVQSNQKQITLHTIKDEKRNKNGHKMVRKRKELKTVDRKKILCSQYDYLRMCR